MPACPHGAAHLEPPVAQAIPLGDDRRPAAVPKAEVNCEVAAEHRLAAETAAAGDAAAVVIRLRVQQGRQACSSRWRRIHRIGPPPKRWRNANSNARCEDPLRGSGTLRLIGCPRWTWIPSSSGSNRRWRTVGLAPLARTSASPPRSGQKTIPRVRSMRSSGRQVGHFRLIQHGGIGQPRQLPPELTPRQHALTILQGDPLRRCEPGGPSRRRKRRTCDRSGPPALIINRCVSRQSHWASVCHTAQLRNDRAVSRIETVLPLLDGLTRCGHSVDRR